MTDYDPIALARAELHGLPLPPGGIIPADPPPDPVHSAQELAWLRSYGYKA
jgi:hypothetical protein